MPLDRAGRVPLPSTLHVEAFPHLVGIVAVVSWGQTLHLRHEFSTTLVLEWQDLVEFVILVFTLHLLLDCAPVVEDVLW